MRCCCLSKKLPQQEEEEEEEEDVVAVETQPAHIESSRTSEKIRNSIKHVLGLEKNSESSIEMSPLQHDDEEDLSCDEEEIDKHRFYLSRIVKGNRGGEQSYDLSMILEYGRHIPLGSRKVKRDGFYVEVRVINGHHKRVCKPVISEPVYSENGNPNFDALIVFKNIIDTDLIRFKVGLSFVNKTSWKTIAKTTIPFGELRTKEKWDELWLFHGNSIPTFDKKKENPSILCISNILVTEISHEESSDRKSLKIGISKNSFRVENNKVDLSPIDVQIEEEEDNKNDLILKDGENDLNDDEEENDLNDDEEENDLNDGEVSETTTNSGVNWEDDEDTEQESDDEEDDDNNLKDVSEETHQADQDKEELSKEAKHMLVITRGTRGDVQPFVALARGLAEMYGWTITICTEMRYKNWIQSYCNVTRGKIRFVPSGGDTETRISKPIAKWAVQTKLSVMHAAILGHTEREFFDSEPAFYYWAKRLKPDLICYTFTTTNLALILGEALKIPIVGFFLQPTILPSTQYKPITPIRLQDIQKEMNTDAPTDSPIQERSIRWIKRQFENNVFTNVLSEMRRRRGLAPLSRYSNDFDIIKEKNFNLIIPIKEQAFGGKPKDWPDKALMTDFIFLRGDSVPPLDDKILSFIENAKSNGLKLMAICFSSMPVSKNKIMSSALHILEKCPAPYKPAIIALVGNRPETEILNKDLKARGDVFIEQKRLLVVRGAPFSRLFPKLDFLVIHGGLGTTAEAIAAGVPTMVTGVLLMDQRFWGRRVFELGIGPPPCHISDFNSKILPILPQVFDPESEYSKNAKKVSAELFPGGIENMDDGVATNAKIFYDLAHNEEFMSTIVTTN